jgi:hypothetical protein
LTQRAALPSKNQVEAADVFRTDSADSLATEDLLGVDDRRAVGVDGGGLALQRIEPSVGPVGEPDVRVWSIVTLLDRVLHAEQSQFSLLAVSTRHLLVRELALANYHVVDRPLRASAASNCFVERRPGTTESAMPRVFRLKTRHIFSLLTRHK